MIRGTPPQPNGAQQVATKWEWDSKLPITKTVLIIPMKATMMFINPCSEFSVYTVAHLCLVLWITCIHIHSVAILFKTDLLTLWWGRQSRDCFTSDAQGNSGYPLRYWGISTPAPSRAFWQGTSQPSMETAPNRTARPCKEWFVLAERITGSALLYLKDMYTRWCKTKIRRLIKDTNQPDNGLFSLLRSRRRYRIHQANNERLRKSFYPQATTILNEDTV